MKTLDLTPFTPEQFQQLALYKARGYAWDDIAAYVKMPVETIERVAWTHEKQWHRTLAKAEQIVARETISEMVACLRRDMQHADPKLHPTITNSLTRVLKQQQDFAPKKRPRRVLPAAPVTPTPTVVPEIVKPVEVPKPADLPPPTPKMTIEEMIALKKRVRDRLAGVAGTLLAFVCLCGLLFGRVARTSSAPTFSPVVASADFVAHHETQVATKRATSPLAPLWRAPPGFHCSPREQRGFAGAPPYSRRGLTKPHDQRH